MEKAPGGGSRLRVWGTPLARGGAFFLGALDRRRRLVCSPPPMGRPLKKGRQGGDRGETGRRQRGGAGVEMGRVDGEVAVRRGRAEVSWRCRGGVAQVSRLRRRRRSR